MFGSISRDKEFLRTFFMIALPITGQNFLNFGVSMADTIMVGQLGEIQLSAVQQANQLGFLMTLTIIGLGSGANVMIAQYWGKGDIASIHKVITIAYRLLAVVGVLFTVLAVGFPHQVMRVLGVAAIAADGVAFLRIVGLGYVFAAFSICTLVILRSVSSVKVALVVSSITLIVSVTGNWILIFGNLGAPALGLRGAAITTLIARLIEFVIVLVYILKFEKKLRYPLRKIFTRGVSFLRKFTENAAPVFLNEVLWGAGAVTLSIIIGQMGTHFIAANSVNMVLSNLVSVAVFGSAGASAVIIGNTVGAGKYDLARQRSNALLAISMCMGVIAMCLVLLLKGPLISIFPNLSYEARVYADQIMTISAFIVLLQAFTFVSVIGVLRGGGDGRFAAIADVVTMWGFALPLGFLAGHVWGLSVPVVYALLKADELLKVIVCLPRLISGKWVRDVTIDDSPKKRM